MRRESTEAKTEMNQMWNYRINWKAAAITMLRQAVTNSLGTNESNGTTKNPGRTIVGERLRQLHEGNVIAQPLRLVLAVINNLFHQVGRGWTVQQGN